MLHIKQEGTALQSKQNSFKSAKGHNLNCMDTVLGTGTGIQHFLKNICGPQWIPGIGYDMGTCIGYRYVSQNRVSLHLTIHVHGGVYKGNTTKSRKSKMIKKC